MKMNKENCIKLYRLIIQEKGRPAEKILKENFSTSEAMEISRELNIGRLAVFTENQLVTMAEKTIKKIA